MVEGEEEEMEKDVVSGGGGSLIPSLFKYKGEKVQTLASVRLFILLVNSTEVLFIIKECLSVDTH